MPRARGRKEKTRREGKGTEDDAAFGEWSGVPLGVGAFWAGGGEGACSGAWLESLVTSIQALQTRSVKSCRACYKGLLVSLYHLQGFDSTG